jgi:hypothetical protein
VRARSDGDSMRQTASTSPVAAPPVAFPISFQDDPLHCCSCLFPRDLYGGCPVASIDRSARPDSHPAPSSKLIRRDCALCF